MYMYILANTDLGSRQPSKVIGPWHIPAMPIPCLAAWAMPEPECPWTLAVTWQLVQGDVGKVLGKCLFKVSTHDGWKSSRKLRDRYVCVAIFCCVSVLFFVICVFFSQDGLLAVAPNHCFMING